MVKLVDTRDLKSRGLGISRAGSSPAPGTTILVGENAPSASLLLGARSSRSLWLRSGRLLRCAAHLVRFDPPGWMWVKNHRLLRSRSSHPAIFDPPDWRLGENRSSASFANDTGLASPPHDDQRFAPVSRFSRSSSARHDIWIWLRQSGRGRSTVCCENREPQGSTRKLKRSPLAIGTSTLHPDRAS